MVNNTKTAINEKNVACNPHATCRTLLNKISIQPNIQHNKTLPLLASPVFNLVWQSVACFLIMALVFVGHASGQEPSKRTSSANVSVTIFTMDQIVEMGSQDTSSIRSGNKYSRQVSDTIIQTRHLHILTLNCE